MLPLQGGVGSVPDEGSSACHSVANKYANIEHLTVCYYRLL